MRPSRTTLASMTLAAGITVLGTGTGLAMASSSAPVEVEVVPTISVEMPETTEVIGITPLEASTYETVSELNVEVPIFEDGCPPCGMG